MGEIVHTFSFLDQALLVGIKHFAYCVPKMFMLNCLSI